MQMKSKLNPIISDIVKILIISLFLSFLVTPVFGYSTDSDDPQDYALTELPTNYLSSNNEYYSNGRYVQHFYSLTDEGHYISNKDFGVIIYTINSYYDTERMNEEFEYIKKSISENNDESYTEISELYGIGDKSYKIINNKDTSSIVHLLFIQNHIIIDIYGYESYSYDIDFSELIKFANFYENKINSILDNQPQMFANIDLENSIYYAGDSFTYTITLSEDANVVIENKINDGEWTFIDSRKFYEKGQHTLYASVESNNIGNEKIKLTATSLKGSTATSTVSFTSKEKPEVIPEDIPYEVIPEEISYEEIPAETSTSASQLPGFSIMYALFMGFLAYYKKTW